MGSNLSQGEYESSFQSLDERIQHVQLQAALSINRELSSYWQGDSTATTATGLGRKSY